MRKNIVDFAKSIYRAGRTYFLCREVLSYQEAQRQTEVKKMEDERRVTIRQNVELTPTQKQDIDELFLTNYGQKVPYTWHEHYMAFTGNFDVNYFPELLYIPEFEYYMNQNEAYSNAIEDKNFISNIAESEGVKCPKCILSCIYGVYRDDENKLVSREDAIAILTDAKQVFIKPTVGSGSGRGCFVADFQNGEDIISKKSVRDILNELGDNFAIQEIIVCSDSITKLYSGSVNTFRIISYIWKDEILTMPVIMRIGQGGNCVDNAHAGGMFIAVEDDGYLHERAFTEFKQVYTDHPDTKVVFKDYQINGIPDILDAVKRLHARIPQIGVINWDFTIDKNELPILVEANVKYGSIWLCEIAHGKGAFGERTAEVLQWLRLMHSLSEQDYTKCRYGKITD